MKETGDELEATFPCGKSLADLLATPNVIEPTPETGPRPIARPARLLIVGLALGAAAEVFLYQDSLGIGVLLFVLCAVVAVFAVGFWESEGNIRWRNVTPLAATTLFFAAMVAIRGGGIITAINVAICLRLGAFLIEMFARRDLLKVELVDLIGIPLRMAGRLLVGARPVVQSLEIPGSDTRRRVFLPAGRGLLLAAPVLIVVTALFSSADPVFGAKVGEFGAWLFPADYWDRIFRIGFALIVAWASIGGIAHAVSSNAESAAKPGKALAPGFTEAMTVLVLVNAVFVSFVLVQFDYLFSGAHRVSSMPAHQYTEYVHSGFGQLISVSVISILLLSALCAAIDPASINRKCRQILNGSGLALLGLTLVVLLSAAQRMSAYEAAYGATVMRTYVDDAILGIGVALLWRGVTLYARGEQTPSFGAGLLACLVGFGIAVNFQNPEGTAIRKNLARFHATGQVDNHFFSQSVSVDAVHDLCAAYRGTSGEMHATIGAQLRLTLDDLETQRQSDKWPSWHAGRASALAELTVLTDELPNRSDAVKQLNSSQ